MEQLPGGGGDTKWDWQGQNLTHPPLLSTRHPQPQQLLSQDALLWHSIAAAIQDFVFCFFKRA